jgi:hypothetical protein
MTTYDLSATTAASTLKRLLVCGVIAGPLFTTAWLVEGATRAHYNPLRHPVSSLELGDSGWTQMATFIITGLLTLAFAVGLRRGLRPLGRSTWGPLLVAAYAIGLIGAGIFVTDPVSGYPPGTPDFSDTYTSLHAALHDLFSVPVFVALPAACAVLAWRFAGWSRRGWAIYSAVTAVGLVVAFVLTTIGFGQAAGLVELGGLFQRITLTLGSVWLTLLALYLLQGRLERQANMPPQA